VSLAEGSPATGRIVSAGSIIVDMSLRVPQLPQPGGDVLATPPVLAVGGGFNLVCAAARQGAAVAYAGRHGTGPHGDLVRQALSELGVPAMLPATAGSDTGVCLTFVDDQAERSFVTAPGAEASLTEADLRRISLQPGDFLALSGYDLAYPGSVAALTSWVSSLPGDLPVLLDPGPLLLDIPAAAWQQILPRLAVLTLNDREARLLVGPASPASDKPAPRHARLRETQPLRPGTLLIIRNGPGGCTFDGGAGEAPVTAVPALPVVACDSTGAGDIHTGVFLAERQAGLGVREALYRANVAAAISVTRPGPSAAPAPAEITTAIVRQQAELSG
jgi:ribokinase